MQQAPAFLKTLLRIFVSSRASGLLCRMRQARFAASATLFAALLGLNAPAVEAAGNHLDYTFTDDGKVTTGYGGGINDQAAAVAIQTDGKIVAVGFTTAGGGETNFAVFRYNADGTLDTSFSSDGRQFTDFGGAESARAVALQEDGKIVVVGYYNQHSLDAKFAVARYNANGLLDRTFSNDGLLLFGFPKVGDVDANIGIAEAVAIQSDGKIIVAGKNGTDSGTGSFALARLNSDGSFDTTLNYDGKTGISAGYGDYRIYGVVALPDGKIVVAGNGDPYWEGNTTGNQDFVLVRFFENGSLDYTFEGNGIVRTDFSGRDDSPRGGLKRTLDGKFILAGHSESREYGDSRVALARYNPDGTLDLTFDGDGKVLTALPFVYGANDVAVSLDGNIVVACSAQGGVPNAGGIFMLLRYRSDGELDDTFGTGGKVITIFGTLKGTAHGVAIQFDGRITAVGTYSSGGNVIYDGDFAVARYNREGIATRSDFDEDGRADFAVFRPAEGMWYINNSSGGGVESFQCGSGSIPVPGDYDGDGKTDVAVYRPSSPSGWWYILRSSDQTMLSMLSGTAGDIPVQGDYDGDSRTDIAIFRPSTGYWYLHRSTLGTYIYANFGQPTDKLVQADYDGDGLTDVALFRPSTGTWYAWRSTLGFKSTPFGTSGDIPVPADYDGDGRADLALFRPSDRTWHITNSLDNSIFSFAWYDYGSHIPAPADFDADGKTDAATFSWDMYWCIKQSTNGSFLAAPFGQNGDVPISSAYTPQ